MGKLPQLIFFALRELIYDTQDEIDFEHPEFNTRKFILLVIIAMSLSLNTWQFHRLYLNTVKHRTEMRNLEKTCIDGIHRLKEHYQEIITSRQGIFPPPNK